jgi:hypothetical protein
MEISKQVMRPWLIEHELFFKIIIIIIIIIILLLGPLACFLSELICNCGSYRESVRLLGRGISPFARPLHTQGNTNTEETWIDIHASSGIRSHNPND